MIARPPHGGQPTGGEPVGERAFRLMTAFGACGQPLSPTSLGARSGLPKSTALRLARSLVELGALERRSDGRYTIGLRLLELATLAPRGHGIRTTVLPHMQRLHRVTQQHVALAVRDGVDAVLVELLHGPTRTPSAHRVGGRIPLHATALGQCLLAYAPAAPQEVVLAGDLLVTGEDVRMSADDLRTRLADIRCRGIALVSRTPPHRSTTVAGPVFDGDGQVVAALAVIAPTVSCDVAAVRSAVTTTCLAMSLAMSGGDQDLRAVRP